MRISGMRWDWPARDSRSYSIYKLFHLPYCDGLQEENSRWIALLAFSFFTACDRIVHISTSSIGTFLLIWSPKQWSHPDSCCYFVSRISSSICSVMNPQSGKLKWTHFIFLHFRFTISFFWQHFLSGRQQGHHFILLVFWLLIQFDHGYCYHAINPSPSPASRLYLSTTRQPTSQPSSQPVIHLGPHLSASCLCTLLILQ